MLLRAPTCRWKLTFKMSLYGFLVPDSTGMLVLVKLLEKFSGLMTLSISPCQSCGSNGSLVIKL